MRSWIDPASNLLLCFKPHLYIVVKQGQSVMCKPCGVHCTCLDQIKIDMSETLKHFSSIKNPPEDIAVALFECFEAMQSFDYNGMLNCTVTEHGPFLRSCPGRVVLW